MRFLLIVLCLLAAALYLKILLPDEFQSIGFETFTQTADDAPVETDASQQGLRPVPDTQMQIIKDVFAPELSK